MIIESKDILGKNTLIFDSVKHLYTLNKKPIIGVTTANKQGYPISENLLKWQIKQGIKEYETKEMLTKAANIGKSLHAYAEAKTLGKWEDINKIVESIDGHEDEKKIRNTMFQFDDWYHKNQPDRVILTETILASPKYKFGGQLDLLVQRGNSVILKDYKTTSGIYTNQFIQLALYSIGLKEWYGITVNELEIVQFPKDGSCFNHRSIIDKKEIKKFQDQGIRNVKTAYFRREYEK